MTNGDEVDALSKNGKRFLVWKPGERKAIKRGYNRRNRKTVKEELRERL
ncbi:MAG: hypothetical protein LC650_03850 [Actinobacteria bacterium]|nr:hypothetical protein [Actinomycetota bacterium]